MGSRPAQGVLEGVGQGQAYAAARAAALGALCQSLRVEVSSRTEMVTTMERRSGAGRDSASTEEFVRMVDQLQATCHFEGMPIREVRSDGRNGDFCVVLNLRGDDYYEHLRAHSCEVVVSGVSVQGDALRSVAVSDLRRRGFMPVETGAAGAKYTASLAIQFEPGAPGVAGLVVGRGRVAYAVKEKASGRIVRDATPDEVVVRGFDASRLVGMFEEEAARSLATALDRTGGGR